MSFALTGDLILVFYNLHFFIMRRQNVIRKKLKINKSLNVYLSNCNLEKSLIKIRVKS